MEETLRQILAILQGMWLKRWLGLAVALVVAVMGLIGVSLFKDRYEATASIYVDTQSVLKPLMSGLAFQPDIDQQISMLAKTLISRPNIERLMNMPGTGLKPADPREYDAMITRLMQKIKISASGKGNFYGISYADSDKEHAGKVVEGLVNMFVSSGLGDKRRDSEDARRFIDEQIHTYEAKLSESENRLKDFKLKNFGLTGTSNQDFFARIATLTDEITRLRLDLRAAEQSSLALRRQLAEENPQIPLEAMGGQTGAAMSEVDTRLESQRKQLDDLLRRYTEDHPDVVAARRTIARLEQQKKQETDAARAAIAGGGRGLAPAATSPVFQRIKISLAESEAKAAALRAQLGEQEARLAQARSTAGRVPQVEAEFAQLNRDYDVIRKNYEQLVSRRESAALGVKIDESAQTADFRVIEPPRVLPTPVFPSRMVLALLVMLASIAAGVVSTFGLTQLLPTLHSVRSLAELSGRPVLGTVNLFISNEEKAAASRDAMHFGIACALLLAVQCGWVAWIWQHART